jgi:hypothetical protein
MSALVVFVSVVPYGAATAQVRAGSAELTLTATYGECYGISQPVSVSVDMTDTSTTVVGGQFFLSYDVTALAFVSIDPGDPPFTNELHEYVDTVSGEIDYAVGIPLGGQGTSEDRTMAVLNFIAVDEACNAAGLVSFREHDPPSRLGDATGENVDLQLNNLGPITIDGPPIIGGLVASGGAVNDECEFELNFSATVTDDCCIMADDVTVVATLVTGDAALSPVVNLVQVGPAEVSVDGTVTLSDLTSCAATVQLTLDASDCCQNSAVQVQQTADVSDEMPPAIDCPAEIVIDPDAGSCEALVTFDPITATDNCDSDVSVICDYAGGDVEPAGTTITVTCQSTDHCGNDASCIFDVMVSSVNKLLLDVELEGVTTTPVPFSRCITLELWRCGEGVEVVEEVVNFTEGLGSTTVSVPCGEYTCITARDKLHTLRRTIDPIETDMNGAKYVAVFTDSSDKKLVGGNFNDLYNNYIDIIDFGVYNYQWGIGYGTPPTGDTDCASQYPHADVSGDGWVDNIEFSFILANFLETHEPNCCGRAPGVASIRDEGPIMSISASELRRRGMGHLVVADLNGDGWVDEADVAAFSQGARPLRRAREISIPYRAVPVRLKSEVDEER